MIMPAGIYHRFTTDTQNVSAYACWEIRSADTAEYTKAMRLFKEDPKWTPLTRGDETDNNPYRQDYLKTYKGLALTSHEQHELMC
jgi:1,2-dihydroxy-3-keto-5-methylthiopentene dioxygenase